MKHSTFVESEEKSEGVTILGSTFVLSRFKLEFQVLCTCSAIRDLQITSQGY